MTPDPAPPAVLRFIAALHRRAVVLRVAERAGLGLLGGAALAIVLTLLLWRQDQASVGVALAAIGAGGVFGFAWGVARRPSRLDAAVQADAQLALDDLLGTAVTLTHHAARTATEPWALTVLAVAESTCRTRSPSAVVLHRLGARVWGGIGLASALALTLAILVSAPTGSVANVAQASSPTSADGSAGRPRSPPLIAIASDSALRTRAPGDPEEPAGPAGQLNPDRAAAAQPKANGPPPEAGADPSAGGASAGDPAGSGAGFSKTSTTPPAAPRPPEANPGGPEPTAPPAAGNRLPAGGVTGSDPTATPAAAAPPGIAGRTAAGTSGDPVSAPPWQAASWSNDVQAARQQLDAGRVAPAYRDLVRLYFEASPRR